MHVFSRISLIAGWKNYKMNEYTHKTGLKLAKAIIFSVNDENDTHKHTFMLTKL